MIAFALMVVSEMWAIACIRLTADIPCGKSHVNAVSRVRVCMYGVGVMSTGKCMLAFGAGVCRSMVIRNASLCASAAASSASSAALTHTPHAPVRCKPVSHDFLRHTSTGS